MAKTFSTPSKVKIRQEWNLPLLKLISEKTGQKLVYLGLPSPDADDIHDWIEYIDKVIAFQCRAYPEPSNSEQGKEAIEELENKLNHLETQGKISNYSIYDGYIEEVLLRGRDISNNTYNQEDVITLYNLDYCNSLSAPISYIDLNGEVKEGYKFDTIQKLMEFQHRINVDSKKFILFLTINCDYFEPEMGELIGDGCDRILKPIHDQYENIDDIVEKKARLLRSYTIQNLKTFFTSNGFIPEFLPTINYNGKPLPKGKGRRFILLHFTVLGTQMAQRAGVAPFYQNIDDVIRQNFIYVRDGVIQEVKIPDVEEQDVNYTPEEYMLNCESFVRHWNKDE